MKFFINNTNIYPKSLNHIFNSILIIINYNADDIKSIDNIFNAFFSLDIILLEELCDQLNEFNDSEFNEFYDSTIFETFAFFKKFRKLIEKKLFNNMCYYMVEILEFHDAPDE